MARKKMKAGRDKRVFRQTAMKTKKINVNPRMTRGGIIL